MELNQAVKDLRNRCDGAIAGIPKYDNGVHVFSPERCPVTVPHGIMITILNDSRSADFSHLRDLLQESTGTISREYPISHLRALVAVFNGGE